MEKTVEGATMDHYSTNGRTCPHCGKNVLAEALYCGYCGNKLDMIPDTKQTAAEVNQKESNDEVSAQGWHIEGPETENIRYSGAEMTEKFDTSTTEIITAGGLGYDKNVCPGCGRSILPGSSFCPYCGRLFDNPEKNNDGPIIPPVPPYVPESPKPGPKHSKAVLLACIASLSVICLALAGLYFVRVRSAGDDFVVTDSTEVSNSVVTSTPTPIPTVTSTPAPTSTPMPTSTPTPLPTPTPQITINPVNIIDTSTGNLITVPNDTPDSYGFPDSNTRAWSYSDVSGMTAGEVRYCLNEIYGRHGYIYRNHIWTEYFTQKTWYVPSIPADSFSDSYLSSTELSNVYLLLQYYEDMNYPPY